MRSRVLLAALLLLAGCGLGGSGRAAPEGAGARAADEALPLGAAGLPERRTTTELQPGVTLTTIERGAPDPTDVWTVEVAVPSASSDPDAPATALSDRATATRLADGLRDRGLDARVEQVIVPPVGDSAGGPLGWRVRIGRLGDRAAADLELRAVVAAGHTGRSVFTGWDGRKGGRGPWRLHVLVVDPRRFRGALVASHGADLARTETTSELARQRGATAAVNAGYFVLDPAAGAPGDPAGAGVYDGALLSEPVRDLPALLLAAGRPARVVRLRWQGEVAAAGVERLPLDGIDRVPGLIRNCGGTPDDRTTSRPLHDVTCTDPDELVLFTQHFGSSTPAGPGAEVVLDAAGVVVALRAERGGAVPAGGSSLQATGALAPRLAAAATVGSRVTVTTRLLDERDRPVDTPPGTWIVNGGPVLVRGGVEHVTVDRDGFVRPGDPSFYDGFCARRNPRTFAGVDRLGRTILVTADGRSAASLGLSLAESAAVARALGMQEALNLDGGGSTTLVVRDRVVNQPSDTTGERPVGDAILVLP